MSTVNNATAASATAGAGAAASGAAGGLGGTSTAEMSERFLTLLVAQMRNQDPLSPLDNAQMTTQLAQINTVNGIERLNATMTAFTNSFASYQAVQATSLIGRQALVPGSSLQLAGGAAQGGAWLDEAADRVQVSVLDRAGQVVDAMELGAAPGGAVSFEWDGRRSDGSALPDGSYSFQVKAFKGTSAVTAQPLTWGQVTGATLSAQGATVELAGLGAAKISDIRQIQ